jgi:hypothetical protein
METTFRTMIELETVIGRLSHAIEACDEAQYTPGQGYPYATGFAMSAMQNSLESLVKLKKQLMESDYD